MTDEVTVMSVRGRLTLYTHAIGALSVNDFILAAKINNIA